MEEVSAGLDIVTCSNECRQRYAVDIIMAVHKTAQNIPSVSDQTRSKVPL